MRLVQPSFEILHCPEGKECLKRLERICRVAYKSEDKICDGSAERLIRNILSRDPPHESVIEHESITVLFVANRGFSHELVRHRLCSFTQESTRYCDYKKGKFGNEISVIVPQSLCGTIEAMNLWKDEIAQIEATYLAMRDEGIKPEIARGVLPIDLKTEIVITANLRQWRHIFKLRCDKAAHPDMRSLMCGLRAELRKRIPVIFD